MSALKIAVCLKIVRGEPNPFDACALEEALRLSEDVTVLSMAPLAAKEALSELTRLGAKVILLSDRAYAGSDTLSTSRVLAAALKKLSFDLVLCGRQSIDGDTAQVGPALSAMLHLPVITNVLSIHAATGGTVRCTTRLGKEEAHLPAVLTVERTCDLRFPSIRSKKAEVTVWDNHVLQLEEGQVGLSGSPTRVVQTFEKKEAVRRCRFVDLKALPLLTDRLSKEARLEKAIVPSKIKLPEVWAVGKAVEKAASAIAERVVCIKETSVDEIYRRAIREKPAVILWEADLLGRRKAPMLSARLSTGLCADCTALETDGTTLFMYRPAQSGDIVAKIVCRTRPVMATVRTETKSADVVLAVGRGAASALPALTRFAESIGAQMAASRGLVDMNLAPYEWQVGLTGAVVAPRVYLAVGISGAAHHTCAIERSGAIIAVNPDKNARIFQYADYGVLARAEDIFPPAKKH